MSFMRGEDGGQTTTHPTPPGPASAANLLIVPILPLVQNVIFPKSVYPLSLRGEQAELIVQASRHSDNLVALFLQQDGLTDEPTAASLHSVGTLARLSVSPASGDDLTDVVVEGVDTVRLLRITQLEPFAAAEVELLHMDPQQISPGVVEQVTDLYRRLLASDEQAEQTLLPLLEDTADPLDLVYLIASTVPISPEGKQAILELDSTGGKLLRLLGLLRKAVDMASRPRPNEHAAKHAVSGPTLLDHATRDRIELEHAIATSGLPSDAQRVVAREMDRLSTISPASPDYSILHTYLQTLADLPWQPTPEPEIDLDRAAEILDRDHYGMRDIKQRILEHLAVRKLRLARLATSGNTPADTMAGASRPPVLCLVGPPGVGKTSLGRSIAEALDRPFVRIPLGGITDEAEIRGHRRTYLGAMPGRIIQALLRTGSNQPVIMLDEMDKIGASGKGDPAAALLDVLDPEQQRQFIDHYIDLPVDISSVLFIATANTLETLSGALRDRLEICRLPGYTDEEKLEIALRHIIPRQMHWHALEHEDLQWEPCAVAEVVEGYTREAGVRQLERDIAAVCRRVATLVARGQQPEAQRCVDSTFVTEVLGPPQYTPEEPDTGDLPGIAAGVFWTPVGGEVMHVEAVMMPGSKVLTTTGQLGEVMRESAQAALSYVRARASELGIEPSFFEQHDIHMHVPSGAVSKDGPSAGITLATALVSLLTGIAVPSDLAMTGELTLRGRVLPVGGIKEKVLAARRSGIKRLILPSDNRRDLESLRPEVLENMTFLFVDTMDDILRLVFENRCKRMRSRRSDASRPAMRTRVRTGHTDGAAARKRGQA